MHTTLTVSPRRGRVLIAKALVIGSVTFAAGLAGAVVVVLLGEPHARADGFSTLTVPPLTEVRVLAGTLLLLAVTAIFALALGAILRRSASVIAIVVAITVLPYILGTVGVLPAGPAEWLLRVTPAAGFAIQQSVPFYQQVMNIYTPPNGSAGSCCNCATPELGHRPDAYISSLPSAETPRAVAQDVSPVACSCPPWPGRSLNAGVSATSKLGSTLLSCRYRLPSPGGDSVAF